MNMKNILHIQNMLATSYLQGRARSCDFSTATPMFVVC